MNQRQLGRQLAKLLRSCDYTQRRRALADLPRYHGSSRAVVKGLVQALIDSCQEDRINWLESLERLGRPAIEELEAILRSDDPKRRRQLLEALSCAFERSRRRPPKHAPRWEPFWRSVRNSLDVLEGDRLRRREIAPPDIDFEAGAGQLEPHGAAPVPPNAHDQSERQEPDPRILRRQPEMRRVAAAFGLLLLATVGPVLVLWGWTGLAKSAAILPPAETQGAAAAGIIGLAVGCLVGWLRGGGAGAIIWGLLLAIGGAWFGAALSTVLGVPATEIKAITSLASHFGP